MRKLFFDPVKHTYTTVVETNPISVTTLIGEYSHPFDENYWLKYKAWEFILFPNDLPEKRKEKFRKVRKNINFSALGDPAVFDILESTYPNLVEIVNNEITSNIKSDWDIKNKNSIITGTAYHDYKEKESISTGTCFNLMNGLEYKTIVPYTWEEGIKKQVVDMHNLKEGFYPELIIYYDGVIGQADKVFIDDDKGFYISDYKTNAKLTYENKFQRMLAPLGHLEDCKINIYSIQLSMYAYMLSSYGYECKGLLIEHLNREIPVQYMRDEVFEIFKHNKFKTEMSGFKKIMDRNDRVFDMVDKKKELTINTDW